MSPAIRPLAVGAAIGLLATVSACATVADDDEAPRDVRIAVTAVGSPVSDPFAYGNLIFMTGQASYEALVQLNQSELVYEPWLASEYTLSDDRRTLTLVLRDDVTFTDGTRLDAAGAEEYFDALFASEGYAFYSLTKPYATEVTAVGENVLEFTTTVPMGFDYFLYLSYTPVASAAAMQTPDALATEAVGTGPYVVSESEPEVSISYVKNPDYWDPDEQEFETITLVAFSDPIAALNALKSGQVDAAAIDGALGGEAEASGLTIHSGRGSYGTLIILDRDGDQVPALADLRVRQAMSLAFDRASIVENVDFGYGDVDNQPFTQGQAGYLEGENYDIPYDIERARELMAEAGYADGFDLTIPTSAVVDAQYTNRYEPIVQQTLADIGIRVTYEPYPDIGALFGAWSTHEYPVVLMQMLFGNAILILHEGTGLPMWDVLDGVERDLLKTIDEGTSAESTEAETALAERFFEESLFIPFAKPQILWASVPELSMVVGDFNGFPYLRSFAPTR